MTEDEARRLIHIGDKIKIVDKWPEDGSAMQNSMGMMDKYLGSILTVERMVMRGVDCRFRVKEDAQTWVWYPAAIQYVRGKEILPFGLEELI